MKSNAKNKSFLFIKKTLLFIILCLSFSLGIFSQTLLPKDIPTPNASNLGRYGDIPVSYYTGRASVSIPLFSTEVKGVPFNMNLDYDTSGILVNSLPSWTGQNWTLNVGGVITRSVQDRQDELIYPQSGDVYEDIHKQRKLICDIPSYFQNYSKLPALVSDGNKLKEEIGTLCGDLSPDVFTFNFMGKTGKFFFGNDGQWKVLSDENFDVIMDIKNDSNFIEPFIQFYPNPKVDYFQPKTIRGFIIRDGQGNSYQFGYYNDTNGIKMENQYPIDYDISLLGVNENTNLESWKANSWYLTEVRDKNNNLLYKFQYERGKFIAQLYVAYSYIHPVQGSNKIGVWPSRYAYTGPNSASFSGNLQSPVYLSKIQCMNGITMEFTRQFWNKNGQDLYPTLKDFWAYEYNIINDGRIEMPYYYLQADKFPLYQYENSNKKYDPLSSTRLCNLSEIRIYNFYNNTGSNYWKFSYSNTNRNMLTSLSKESRFEQNVIDHGGKFQFEYNSYASIPSNYLSTAVDHYGYFNNKEYIQECYKNFNVNSYPRDDYIKICREPNEECMKMGMLSRIIYPTGGTTSIKYEANKYNSYINNDRQTVTNLVTPKITGGLRVKSITECEGADTLRYRNYEYEMGELFTVPTYVWYNWTPQTVEGYYTLTMMNTTAIFPLSNSFGPHIGYSRVKELEKDGSYAIYEYNNISSAKDEQAIYQINRNSPYDKFSEHGYKRGKLLSISYYSKNGSIKKKKDFHYNEDNGGKYVYTSNMFYQNFITECSFFSGGIYKLYYPKYDIDNTTDSVYYANGEVVENTNYYERISRTIQLNKPYARNVDIRLLQSDLNIDKVNSSRHAYYYPINENSYPLHKDRFILEPNKISYYKNGVLINTTEDQYKLWEYGIYAPDTTRLISGNSTKTLVAYLGYTEWGALKSYVKDGTKVDLDWWWFDAGITKITKGGNLATSYTYSPFWIPTSKILPNGHTTYYKYDILGRLIRIEEDEGNGQRKIIQSFKYSLVNE